MTESLFEKAVIFATQRHASQKRKFHGIPYITHPLAVALSLVPYTKDESVLAAAVLHDVLEDTETTYAELWDHFGEKVADLVQELTNDEAEMITMGGKTAYLCKKISTLSSDALLIKLADRFHNLEDLALDLEWGRKYALQTRAIVEACQESKDEYNEREEAFCLAIMDRLLQHASVVDAQPTKTTLSQDEPIWTRIDIVELPGFTVQNGA